MIGYEINRCKKCHEPILRAISKRKDLKFLGGVDMRGNEE